VKLFFFPSANRKPSSMEIYSTHVFEILKYYDAVDINGNDYDEFVCFEYHCGWENTFDVFFARCADCGGGQNLQAMLRS
jgi:hypothetical protein